MFLSIQEGVTSEDNNRECKVREASMGGANRGLNPRPVRRVLHKDRALLREDLKQEAHREAPRAKALRREEVKQEAHREAPRAKALRREEVKQEAHREAPRAKALCREEVKQEAHRDVPREALRVRAFLRGKLKQGAHRDGPREVHSKVLRRVPVKGHSKADRAKVQLKEDHTRGVHRGVLRVVPSKGGHLQVDRTEPVPMEVLEEADRAKGPPKEECSREGVHNKVATRGNVKVGRTKSVDVEEHSRADRAGVLLRAEVHIMKAGRTEPAATRGHNEGYHSEVANRGIHREALGKEGAVRGAHANKACGEFHNEVRVELKDNTEDLINRAHEVTLQQDSTPRKVLAEETQNSKQDGASPGNTRVPHVAPWAVSSIGHTPYAFGSGVPTPWAWH